MNFIHTFYSTPLLNNKFDTYNNLLPIIITDYTYSAACCKHFGHTIELYADPIGGEMLSHIPYDNIHIINYNDSIHFAASIKFEAIKNIKPGEALIDGDLFIQDKKCYDLIEEYNKYDFIYSFFEPIEYTLNTKQNIDLYVSLCNKLQVVSDLFFPPYTLPKYFSELTWPNTSFMIFNNQNLKYDYIRQYMYHKNIIKDIDFEECWPDIIIEQYNMKKLLKYGNYTSKAIIEKFPTTESNDYALNIGFTHLGAGKQKHNDVFIEKLKNLNIDLYNKCIEQINYFINKYK